MWAVASAAESVMVMMKLVAAKPSRQQHHALALPARQSLFEHRQTALALWAEGSHLSVHGQGAEERQCTSTSVANGDRAPAASEGDDGW